MVFGVWFSLCLDFGCSSFQGMVIRQTYREKGRTNAKDWDLVSFASLLVSCFCGNGKMRVLKLRDFVPIPP